MFKVFSIFLIALFCWKTVFLGSNVSSNQELAISTLTPTPRKNFKPTTDLKGYWNIDVVDNFVLPSTKSLTFCGAGRNLSLKQDWEKIFKRGFSSVDWTRFAKEEYKTPDNPKANGWKSRLSSNRRALWVGAAHFANPPFSINWARNSELAAETWYKRANTDKNGFNSMYYALYSLSGGCDLFGDCSKEGMKSTYGKIYLDIENDGTSFNNRQEQVNLYVYMMRALRDGVSPQTEIGSIAPTPVNGFGYSDASMYQKEAEWLWKMPARHTFSSKKRGMPDDIVGKSFADFVDFQMPGTYYFYPDFDYAITHSSDRDRHWLAGLLSEQEVNAKLSSKKRISWQWLFNTQSSAFNNSAKSEHPAPPAVAEGVAIFYWFTGAYGTILWDDAIDLTPTRDTPKDAANRGIGSDRYYQCYEHYVHGLWRLFKHHGDMFDGSERYLNEKTECSFDDGRTWQRYNANELKVRNLPFVRAIVRGDQILVSATKPYAKANQATKVQVRYTENGYRFLSEITLRGDEIYLGRATMPK